MHSRHAAHAAAIVVVAALISGAAVAAPAPIKVAYEKIVLKDGLTVILSEDHAVPRVFMSMRYRVGSGRETPGRTGFAHLFEHLMFEGSEHVPEGKFDQWLEAAGGENNAETGEDQTYYFEEVPSNAVDLPLFLDSDRMGTLIQKLAPDFVDKQRDVVKNEVRQNVMNRPWGIGELLLPPAVFPKGHPYSWDVYGSMDDLSAASVDDVRAFWTKWYTPENAILTIVGDFDMKTMKQKVAHWYSDVPGRGAPEKPKPAPSSLKGEKRVVAEDPLAPLAQLTIAWPSVALFDPDDANLDLAASVLSSGAGARLQKRLVHDLQIAQSVSAAQQSHERTGEFSITILAQPDVPLPKILAVVDEELKKLAQDGIQEDELQRAKNQFETSTADVLDSLQAKAAALSSYQAFLGEPDAFERDLSRYRLASPASVVDVVKRRLGKGRVVMSIVPKGRSDLAVINAVKSVGGAE
ncbi:MAG TPA: pitrilysin family protein [Myxococcota bacterium]|jgi:zinc protease